MFGSRKTRRRVEDEVALTRQRSVRFHDERTKPTIPIHQKQAGLAASRLGLGSSERSKIFVAGHDLWFNKIIDPSSDFILKWTYMFRIICFIALFVDPLYFYAPKIIYGQNTSCIGKDRRLAIIVTVFRSITDLFYAIQIIIKFRTAYINPSSTLGVFGRGDLVTDSKEIAKQYLRSDFAVDLVASLPLPQIIVWSVVPAIKYSSYEHDNDMLVLIALFHCYGQTLTVSTYIGETLYAIFLAVLGLVLFAHLIGKVQVPFFSQMDDQLLDAICERLVSSLCTKGTYIVREGDPVTEMLFIIRGKLESSTTDGGRTGFFNSIILKPGDFCGEELLGWALVPKSTVNLPSSTRTVRALVEVEAFALRAEDLRFVASQFRRLHSRKLQHTFRYYSHHWRTWAACFIQHAWRRYKRRKMAKDLSMRESFSSTRSYEEDTFPEQNLVLRRGTHIIKDLPKFKKPSEPDFSVLQDD
ncbi:hypothetical protein PR202_gb17662 [Eleusine coracana subsp. coracana]|uniref:Cyclic nucleotide-binding domain-containing protein n=1 Tax=Eleusine coracana subsp. coracana TaxID=191504 RepID=A0AAV5F3F6_ELECO|nr:hypothetical protein PR202_gb17662 [Eleusine coracana subsp. coracana]